MRILDISLALSVLALSPLTIAETKYETVTGWFLQDDASTDSSTFDFVSSSPSQLLSPSIRNATNTHHRNNTTSV